MGCERERGKLHARHIFIYVSLKSVRVGMRASCNFNLNNFVCTTISFTIHLHGTFANATYARITAFLHSILIKRAHFDSHLYVIVFFFVCFLGFHLISSFGAFHFQIIRPWILFELNFYWFCWRLKMMSIQLQFQMN